MICPYCGAEMKQGALRTSKNLIQWEEGTGFAAWVDVMFGGSDHLTSDKGFVSSKVPAYFCAGCKKMIIETDIG